MTKIINILFLFTTVISATMLIGAGGFDVTKKGNSFSFKDINSTGKHANITEVLHKEVPNINAVSIWITKDWQEDWYSVEDTQKELINKGYTPVYMFYWFADEISPQFVKKNKTNYFKALKKFTKHLKKLNGQKIVILNPEYNMFGCEKWDGMNDIFLKSFNILREDPQVLVGPCVGDFGNYKYTNEPKEWILFDKSLHRAAKKADFIAFQEMRAQTRNSKADMLKTADRALNLSKYLYTKYQKPTILAYLAISSYGKNGEEIQAKIYKKFIKNLPNMQREAKLMFFGTFHYFDYPGHVGYFKKAEEFFGVLRKDGSKKLSYEYFKELK